MFRRRHIAGLVLALFALACASIPSATAAPTTLYFPQTGQAVADDMLQFWQATPNALQILGYPISAPFIQKSATEPGTFYRVQYFERAVLEEHPQPDRTIRILGRLLGNELIAERQREAPFQPVPRPKQQPETWDSVTKHTLSNAPAPFKRFYDRNGGLGIFGRPLSEPFQERNRDTGGVYWVQYFERQRMEWHPEIADPAFQVMLGRLGDEYRRAHPDQVDPAAFKARSVEAARTDRMQYGINATLFYTDQARALRLAKGAGLNWVRQQVQWKDHQGADRQIAWGELDTIVAAAQQQRVNLLFSIVQAPDWATGLSGITGLPDRAHLGDYAAFVGALAQRYRGRVQAYEIWNEINLAPENGIQPIPEPNYYVDLLTQAAATIRAADPDARIISTPLAPTESGNRREAISDLVYAQALFTDPRFWDSIDAVGVHVFGTANPPDTIWPDRPGPGPGWNQSREFYFRRVEDIRRLMVTSGHGNRSIWITEFGWATANNTPGHEFGNQISFQQQADYLVKALDMGRYEYAPWVGAMFVWNLNFAVAWAGAGNPLHQMASYGILNADWSPRPAYTAIQAMPKP